MRAFASHALGPDGKLRQGAVRAMLSNDPVSDERARPR
jgi:hypothetical protein